MTDAVSLHVLCRQEGIRPKGVVPVEGEQHVYDSVSWRVREDQIAGLIGKTFCLHEGKPQPSYMGGEILSIERRPIEDNGGEVRAVVRFRVTLEARGIKWPPTDNPNEYCQVNTDVPIDLLKKR